MKQIEVFLLVALLLWPVWLWAGQPVVERAQADLAGTGTYRFSVTIRHADEGWDHYANGYEILDLQGNVLGTRVLAHPHEHEQPFTRSVSGVKIPASVDQVQIRAQDSLHGYGEPIQIDLP